MTNQLEQPLPMPQPPEQLFKLINSQTLPLTRELVDEFYGLPSSPTERSITPARTKMLKEKHAAGLLVSFHWARCHLNGDTWRMNGQHSVHMLHRLNGDLPTDCYVHLDDYQVANMDGMALLFRQFDDRKSGRTPGDVAGAYQGTASVEVPALGLVPRNAAKLGIEGIAWYNQNVEGLPTPSGDDVYKLFNRPAYHNFLIWIGSLLNGEVPQLHNRAAIAAIYGTWQKSEVGAREFWHPVVHGGVEYEDEAPASVLCGWFDSIAEMTAAEKQRNGIKPAAFYNGCIYAWNAFRRQRTIGRIDYKQRILPTIAD